MDRWLPASGSANMSRSGKAYTKAALALKERFSPFCAFLRGAKVARVQFSQCAPLSGMHLQSSINIREAMSGGSKGRSISQFLYRPAPPFPLAGRAGCNIAALMLNCRSMFNAHGAKEKGKNLSFKHWFRELMPLTGRLLTVPLMPISYSFADNCGFPLP